MYPAITVCRADPPHEHILSVAALPPLFAVCMYDMCSASHNQSALVFVSFRRARWHPPSGTRQSMQFTHSSASFTVCRSRPLSLAVSLSLSLCLPVSRLALSSTPPPVQAAVTTAAAGLRRRSSAEQQRQQRWWRRRHRHHRHHRHHPPRQ